MGRGAKSRRRHLSVASEMGDGNTKKFDRFYTRLRCLVNKELTYIVGDENAFAGLIVNLRNGCLR